jgi:hypothetical protein
MTILARQLRVFSTRMLNDHDHGGHDEASDGLSFDEAMKGNLTEHEAEENEHHEVETAGFFFIALCGLMLAYIAGHLVSHKWKLSWLPEAGAFILVGMFGGLVMKLDPYDNPDELKGFDTTFFFLVLLPPIIFNAGFSMKKRFFFRNMAPILSLAFIGTSFSCWLVAMVSPHLCLKLVRVNHAPFVCRSPSTGVSKAWAFGRWNSHSPRRLLSVRLSAPLTLSAHSQSSPSSK